MTPLDLDRYLADFLRVSLYKDHSPNRMMVEGSGPLRKLITGVSLNRELIEEAVRRKSDGIIVHHPHGFWNEDPKLLRGSFGAKVKLLVENGLSVYGYHLPLDGHPLLGNNALLADALGLIDRVPYMKSGEGFVSCYGSLPEPMPIAAVLRLIGEKVSPVLHHFAGGNNVIRRIALCSGGAPQAVAELLENPGIDLYLTGEVRETTQQFAREEGFHFVACGHHATERFGVRALGEHLAAQFGLDVEFVDIFNPV